MRQTICDLFACTKYIKKSHTIRLLLLLTILFIIFICIVNIINIHDIKSLPIIQLSPTNQSHTTSSTNPLHNIYSNISKPFNHSFNTLNFYLTNKNAQINTNPSVPALAIIGPAKTATTSIYQGLINTYEHWHQQPPIHYQKGNPFEIVSFVTFTRLSILKKYHKKLINTKTILFIKNQLSVCNISIPISQFPFHQLLDLFDQIALNKTIINHTNAFMQSEYNILTDYNYKSMHFRYTIDKAPMNFYLPHVALIFGYYFSYKNILQNVRGLKVLMVIRNPFKRYRSWFGQNCRRLKYTTPKEQFEAVFSDLCITITDALMNNSYLIKFRNMIMNRYNEYDDTQIILAWFKWYYGVIGYALHKPDHGIFPSLYYPQLLVYIYFYQQLGLLNDDRRMFKVIAFDYVIQNGYKALHLIQCWVRFGLDDLKLCLRVNEYPYGNNVTVFPRLNHKSLVFPDSARNKLIEYFRPIKVKVDELLFKYQNVILGEFDGLQSLIY
eukprot:26824_1